MADKDSEDFKPKEEASEALYRIYSVVSYIVILIVIGLPVWWMTTRVYRAPLPLTEMYDVELPARSNKPHGLPLSLEYDILITIVNPDPESLQVDLDGELLDINLQPFLKTLSCVAEFTVKTQWLYLTQLGIVPKKVEDHYVIYEEQLPHVITPLETKLWSHISQRPCINLVLYISNRNTPLFIRDKNKQLVETNAFLSARWGGITILNPTEEGSLYKPELGPIVSTFKEQLRRLLQIEDMAQFKQTKVREMVESTKRTLKSLAQLLSEISSIVISDDVAGKINVAMEYVDKAETFRKNGNTDEALENAKIAYKNSEAAFSDPSLLALLYFPDDQKYAVYIPLFLPVMIPVLMSVVTVRRWYKEMKENKIKTE